MKQKLQIFILDIFFGGREYKTKADTKKTPFPFITVFLALISTVLILCTVFSLVRISELSSEIATLKKQTVSLAAKKASLENELDHRYSFAEIIDSAKELGFSEDGGRVVYIETQDKDQDTSEENENSEDDPS
ncbi:MAG: hypothetical protein E7603_01515 [Ruminococcaceae bacterium]|nr:hypothetical protein [Oscillospiraceae bacterium]